MICCLPVRLQNNNPVHKTLMKWHNSVHHKGFPRTREGGGKSCCKSAQLQGRFQLCGLSRGLKTWNRKWRKVNFYFCQVFTPHWSVRCNSVYGSWIIWAILSNGALAPQLQLLISSALFMYQLPNTLPCPLKTILAFSSNHTAQWLVWCIFLLQCRESLGITIFAFCAVFS